MAADALRRVVAEHGNEAIFAGSYGWASAGRFHHSQSQLHRFLKQLGGYTYSVQSYSTGTAQVIIPHVLGVTALKLMAEAPTIEDALEHARLVVSFGGISMKNTQIDQGGIGDHSARGHLQRWRDAGVEVVCISPVRDDVADFLEADWWPIRPNADAALMLGLAYTLHSEDLHDKDFLRSHCVGYERLVPYLLGASDGVPKDADWAAAICDVESRPAPRACPPDGERALPPVDQLVAAADREPRSALLDDRGARRHARQSRPARPGRRLRLWLHPQFRLRRPPQPAVQGRDAAPGRTNPRAVHRDWLVRA
jgi:anaerobic selenocysteine-containing dehydrogenase